MKSLRLSLTRSAVLGGLVTGLLAVTAMFPSGARAMTPGTPGGARAMKAGPHPGSGMNMMNMMKMMKNKAWVKRVQEALIAHGAHLRADGLCGIHTVQALRRFQKSHGLKVTGMPDPKTLKALGLHH